MSGATRITDPAIEAEMIHLHSVAELRQHCKRVGSYFFSPATMEFFGSEVVRGSIMVSQYGTCFVTSEARDEWGAPTPRYTVRQAMPDGIRTVGEFRHFREQHAAKVAAYLCAVCGADSDHVRAAFAAAQEEK